MWKYFSEVYSLHAVSYTGYRLVKNCISKLNNCEKSDIQQKKWEQNLVASLTQISYSFCIYVHNFPYKFVERRNNMPP